MIYGIGYYEYKTVTDEKPLSIQIEEIYEKSNYIEYEDIPPLFIDAIVSVEDERLFTRQTTLDFEAIARAILVNFRNKKFLQGGSRITQQVAKNIYFDHSASLTRKVSEYKITKDLLENYSKEDILEIYINIIYYGNGAYGLENAAINYFDRNTNNLNDGELTILAGLPQAPSVYDLNNNFKLAKERQAQVLSRMVANQKITNEQKDLIYIMEVIGYE